MQRFLQFRLGSLTTCLLSLVDFLGTNILRELTAYAVPHTVVALLLPMSYT